MPRDILEDLRKYLAGLPNGRLIDADAVVDLLTAVWDDPPGSRENAMASRKLARAEAIEREHR